MIFVTVGTHEQPFNRLVEYMDKWAREHEEDVIIQTGFSTFEPKHAKWHSLLPYSQMIEYIESARIVITHGGPSSFVTPLQFGKIPIVIPRKKIFAEHVNDHQVEFCRKISDRLKNIILVEDEHEIGNVIERYDSIIEEMNVGDFCNNDRFIKAFEQNIRGLVKERKE